MDLFGGLAAYPFCCPGMLSSDAGASMRLSHQGAGMMSSNVPKDRLIDMGGFRKWWVFPPNHPLKNRDFHYFHHPFWGPTPIFGNTHIAWKINMKPSHGGLEDPFPFEMGDL